MRNDWNKKRLSDVCLIRPAKSEAKKALKSEDKVSFIPMDQLGIDQKYFTSDQEKALSEVSNSYTYFKTGDVILAKITPCFENGKLGIAKDLTNDVGFGSSEFIVYRTGEGLFNEYVYYFLNQESFRDTGKLKMTGAVGHKRIPKDFYEDSEIPIPPLPEQKKIVSILDQAFEAIDQAKANIEKNIENAKELFQSKLNEIFSQKGEGWEEKTLDKICQNLDSKRIPITKSKRQSGEIPYYGASGIVDYVKDFILEDDLLLVSEDGANLLARTYPIAFAISGKTWVNNHAHVLKFDNLATQTFVEYYLNSIKLDDFISGMAQPKLNQKKLNSIPIPLPDINTQEHCVNKINQLKAELNQVSGHYANKIDLLKNLKKSLLQKAFSGELTANELVL